MEYNKKGRILGRSSSPRDLQKRNSLITKDTLDNRLVLDLLSKVSEITLELEELKRDRVVQTHPATVVSTDKKYTEEEFNEELIKAIEKELVSSKLKADAKDTKIYALELKIEALTDINNANSMVNKKPAHPSEEVVKIGKRPSIEYTVIDPTDSKTKLDAHINIKEIKEETNMADKVNKLKELLGV